MGSKRSDKGTGDVVDFEVCPFCGCEDVYGPIYLAGLGTGPPIYRVRCGAPDCQAALDVPVRWRPGMTVAEFEAEARRAEKKVISRWNSRGKDRESVRVVQYTNPQAGAEGYELFVGLPTFYGRIGEAKSLTAMRGEYVRNLKVADVSPLDGPGPDDKLRPVVIAGLDAMGRAWQQRGPNGALIRAGRHWVAVVVLIEVERSDV